jgi:hypothetical protein
MKDYVKASEKLCGQLAIFFQRLTAPAHTPEGEPLKKYRSPWKTP